MYNIMVIKKNIVLEIVQNKIITPLLNAQFKS